MCSESSHIILSEQGKNQISWCKCCENYSLIFGNCCIALTKSEFAQIEGILKEITVSDCQTTIADESRVILKNAKANIGFALTLEDRDELLRIIREAKTIREVFQPIYNLKNRKYEGLKIS